ncbi:unnamed protein product [Ilex paraguariensis]|uniref:Uncharacterized protein n=1 Tax=Ilex paraguariensis TaxID=185542 RepID=A0ABC8TIU3_9AQUA
MAMLLSLCPRIPKTLLTSNSNSSKPINSLKQNPLSNSSRRPFILNTASICLLPLLIQSPFTISSAETSPAKSFLSGIANTKSWFQFFGDGFAIRVPPQFEDITEPEDYTAGLSLYGDKAKTKTFAARFASPDG